MAPILDYVPYVLHLIETQHTPFSNEHTPKIACAYSISAFLLLDSDATNCPSVWDAQAAQEDRVDGRELGAHGVVPLSAPHALVRVRAAVVLEGACCYSIQ